MTTVFCSADDVRPLTKVKTTGMDETIDAIIEGTASVIRRYTNRSWDYGTFTEKFRTPNRSVTDNQFYVLGMPPSPQSFKFMVAEPPIAQDGSLVVSYDPTGTFAATGGPVISTLVENADYVVDYDAGMIEVTGFTLPSRNGIQVVYTGGYQVADGTNILQVPANINLAAAMLAAFTMSRILSSAVGKQEEMRASRDRIVYTATAMAGMPGEVRQLLMPARKVMVGNT